MNFYHTTSTSTKYHFYFLVFGSGIPGSLSSVSNNQWSQSLFRLFALDSSSVASEQTCIASVINGRLVLGMFTPIMSGKVHLKLKPFNPFVFSLVCSSWCVTLLKRWTCDSIVLVYWLVILLNVVVIFRCKNVRLYSQFFAFSTGQHCSVETVTQVKPLGDITDTAPVCLLCCTRIFLYSIVFLPPLTIFQKRDQLN